LSAISQIATAVPEVILLYHLQSHPHQLHTAVSLAREVALAVEITQKLLNELTAKNDILLIGEGESAGYVHREAFSQTCEDLKRFLRQFHAENPMRLGIKKSQLKTELFPRSDKEFLDLLLADLAGKGEINVSKEIVAIAGHSIEFSPEQEVLKAKIEKIYYDSAFVTPEFEELVDILQFKKPEQLRDLVTGMVEAGILMELGRKLGKAVIFHAERIEEARQIVIDTIRAGNGEAKFFEIRERLNSTRKFTTPILTHFDEIGLTKRVGDIRILREESSP
jgi:selenocysteine-specific elongation factor